MLKTLDGRPSPLQRHNVCNADNVYRYTMYIIYGSRSVYIIIISIDGVIKYKNMHTNRFPEMNWNFFFI